MKAAADYLARWQPRPDRVANALREQARHELADCRIPTRSDEDWLYVNLNSLMQAELSAPAGGPPTRRPASPPLVWEMQDGVFSRAASEQPGVQVAGLDALVKDDQLMTDLLQKRSSGYPFDLLNLAALDDALVISVSAGLDCRQPLRLRYGFSAEHRTQHGLVVLRLGAGSRCHLIEEEPPTAAGYLNSRLMIQLADGATLTHWRLQVCDRGWQMNNLNVKLAAHADYELVQASLNSRLRRNDLLVQCHGDGATARLKGAFIGFADGQLDNHLTLGHDSPGGHSETRFNGLATGQSTVTFNGRIAIQPDCPSTQATLYNHNLLLSQGAKINTKPELKIYSDDVQCAHGATIGRLSDEAVFYLSSRGIPELTARQMLAAGFVGELLQDLRQEPDYSSWQKALDDSVRQTD